MLNRSVPSESNSPREEGKEEEEEEEEEGNEKADEHTFLARLLLTHAAAGPSLGRSQ